MLPPVRQFPVEVPIPGVLLRQVPLLCLQKRHPATGREPFPGRQGRLRPVRGAVEVGPVLSLLSVGAERHPEQAPGL